MGKVIDVEFRVGDRGRWCVRCDEPFPEGTAMCPRCGGALASAARHRAETQARARKQARRYVASGVGLVVMILAAIAWLLFGPGVARGDEKPVPPPSPATTTAGSSTAATTTTPPPPVKKLKKEKVAAVAPPRPTEGGTPLDPAADSSPSPRPVRVRLLDGSTVVGTVHAEEVGTLVVDCSLGLLSIPRARISTIAYDAAAGVGQKRAPVQQLDDEDKPTKKRATSQP
ncbi:MAG TPA: hypothetical protein VF945_17725 [Polyangia bacterium]